MCPSQFISEERGCAGILLGLLLRIPSAHHKCLTVAPAFEGSTVLTDGFVCLPEELILLWFYHVILAFGLTSFLFLFSRIIFTENYPTLT